MKPLILLIFLFACMQLAAQPIIILENGRNYAQEINSVSPLNFSASELNFIHSVHLSYGHKSEIIEAKPLVIPPIEWGKMESDSTHGLLNHYQKFPHGFYAEVNLFHLIPGHDYVLTLNGNPNLEGNELLPDLVPGMEEERFYDVLRITTDQQGNYQATIAVFLKQGNYHARFYVKDTEDWKIVLYHDYFKFEVD